jgi:hypothetical protein
MPGRRILRVRSADWKPVPCSPNRLFYTRYGARLPDDDDGRENVMIMINHLVMLADPKFRVRNWCSRRAPWVVDSEAEKLVDKTITRPRRWRADALGQILNLTEAERDRLKIRTIGASGVTKAMRIAKRRERDRLAKRLKRRAAGAKPQAKSINRKRPWSAFGISRATYFRRMRRFRPQYEACVIVDEFVSTAPLAATSGVARQTLVTPADQRPPLPATSFPSTRPLGRQPALTVDAAVSSSGG